MKANEFAQKNFMRLENNAAEMQMREKHPEQASADFRSRLLMLGLTLAVLLAVLFFVFRPVITTPAAVQKKKDYFYQFAAEKMADYKPGYYLYEELSDPAALMKMGVWDAFAGAMNDPETAVLHWKGDGYTVQSWNDLVVAECDRLWEQWYCGTEDIAADTFILREVDRSRANKTIPGLGENTWLVTDPVGVQHILVKTGEKGWCIQPLDDFR